MIFLRLDENVSYKIAEAAVTIGVPQGLQFEAPQTLGQTGMKDIPWIEALSKRGRPQDVRCVFSGDRLTEPERAAAETAGLIVFFAPVWWWRKLRRLRQAAYVLIWLEAMIEMAVSNPSGSLIQLPMTFSPRADLKPMASVLRTVSRPGRPRRPRGEPKGLL